MYSSIKNFFKQNKNTLLLLWGKRSSTNIAIEEFGTKVSVFTCIRTPSTTKQEKHEARRNHITRDWIHHKRLKEEHDARPREICLMNTSVGQGIHQPALYCAVYYVSQWSRNGLLYKPLHMLEYYLLFQMSQLLVKQCEWNLTKIKLSGEGRHKSAHIMILYRYLCAKQEDMCMEIKIHNNVNENKNGQ